MYMNATAVSVGCLFQRPWGLFNLQTTFIQNPHTHVCMYLCVSMYLWMCVCMYVCRPMYVRMYVCRPMYVCISVCTYLCMCMYIWMYVCIYACRYVYIPVCMYVGPCMYVCMYDVILRRMYKPHNTACHHSYCFSCKVYCSSSKSPAY
jgi:hypothetical protein